MFESDWIRIKKSIEDEDEVVMLPSTPETNGNEDHLFSKPLHHQQQEMAFSPQKDEDKAFARYRYCSGEFDDDEIEECVIPDSTNGTHSRGTKASKGLLTSSKSLVKSKSTSTLSDSKMLKSVQEPPAATTVVLKNSALAAASIYGSSQPKTPKTKRLTSSKSSQNLLPLQLSPSTPNTASRNGQGLHPIPKETSKVSPKTPSSNGSSARSLSTHRLIERRASNTK
ncbi:hypothetical protein C9374_008258 [Naegleria lovaniensis]|uniref:Uncharacterized protein n=1 Tax=Naegleria lovaniensis TaxID=51637 RepID=A0AA88GJF8_NAELO|nr:uncharacterized protein C9374_008258 [Naegleria lovaniensis]KAG2378619.1 hypothetical protein C9374_008258 [Naegleria lovaniensis]